MVSLEYHELLFNDDRRDTPFRNLVLMKRAIGVVAAARRVEHYRAEENSVEDNLGHVLGFLRAAEKVNIRRMGECAKAYPKKCEYVHPANPEARSSAGFCALKDHAVILARRQITEEVDALQDSASSESLAATSHRKSSILARLKRLLLGAPNTLMAIQCDTGEVTTDPVQMAEALRTHWKKVFSRPWIDHGKLQQWIAYCPTLPIWRTRRQLTPTLGMA